ncbi:hypothetical protein [Asticcacaulis sp. YBE204]|uniref:hypothetical protein n=1 Tax=Asticcacaulis sp. YBE204 TaxID=1282363 RepID=UPI0003C3F8E3|nr:hypothetical protein [Asticcacaulis sp. YBE204]ESQ78469.1 hypothetical protein AEYBE204_13015 [Asticcacaulis sp. YBE204]
MNALKTREGLFADEKGYKVAVFHVREPSKAIPFSPLKGGTQFREAPGASYWETDSGQRVEPVNDDRTSFKFNDVKKWLTRIGD